MIFSNNGATLPERQQTKSIAATFSLISARSLSKMSNQINIKQTHVPEHGEYGPRQNKMNKQMTVVLQVDSQKKLDLLKTTNRLKDLTAQAGNEFLNFDGKEWTFRCKAPY